MMAASSSGSRYKGWILDLSFTWERPETEIRALPV